MVDNEKCPICVRHVKSNDMTIHHYLPKSKGGTLQDTMRICKCCHDTLHYLIHIDQVEFYTSPEKLYKHPEYCQYMDFIRSVTHTSMYSVKQIKNKLFKLVA